MPRARRQMEVTPTWGLDTTGEILPEFELGPGVTVSEPIIRPESQGGPRRSPFVAQPGAGGSVYELVREQLLQERNPEADAEKRIADAERQAALSRTAAQFGRGMSSAADLISGRKAPSSGNYEALEKQAGAPVEAAQSNYERVKQRILEERGLARQATLDERDRRDFGERQAQFQAQQDSVAEGRRLTVEEAEKQRTHQSAENEKNRRNQAAIAAQARAAARERALARPPGRTGATPRGMRMTAGETAKIADFDAATKLADDLWANYEAKASDWYSGISQGVGGTDAKMYLDDRKVAAQVIGGILEGGKLTEEDFQRYYDMLPSPGDSMERAKNKIAAIKNLIGTRRQIQVNTLDASGFDTGSLMESGPEADMEIDQAQPSDEDVAALEWARNNPNDPRAQQILQLHGVK